MKNGMGDCWEGIDYYRWGLGDWGLGDWGIGDWRLEGRQIRQKRYGGAWWMTCETQA